MRLSKKVREKGATGSLLPASAHENTRAGRPPMAPNPDNPKPSPPCSKTRRARALRRVAVSALALLAPALMGGCPEFRNESVTAIETATRGVIDAALNLFFDQFRVDEF